MSSLPLTDDTAKKIKKEYQEFLVGLDSIKNEQDQFIKEYSEKLAQRKLLRLKEQLNIKE